MKTSVIEVHDMLSVFSVTAVEKRIGEVSGVESVTVDFAAGKATVRFDETRLEIADIKARVRQNGYEYDAPGITATGGAHAGHDTSGDPSAMPAPAAPNTPQKAGTGAGSSPEGKAVPPATPKPEPTVSATGPEPASAVPKSVPDGGAPSPASATAASGDEPRDKAAPGKN